MSSFDIKTKVNDVEFNELAKALDSLSWGHFEAICALAGKNIYNRGLRKIRKGSSDIGTPYDNGELMQSLGLSQTRGNTVVGYTKDYAPHVEFGHRTNKGDFWEGLHFLKRNMDAEKEPMKAAMIKYIKELTR